MPRLQPVVRPLAWALLGALLASGARAESPPPSLRSSLSLPDPVQAAAAAGSMLSVILPAEDIVVSVPVSGVIEAFPAIEGQTVRKGDVLLRIEAIEEELAVLQAANTLDGERVSLDLARSNFERARELRQDNIQSQRQFEQAKTELSVAEIRVRQAEVGIKAAEARRDRKTVRAPIDGLFFKRFRAVGESIQALDSAARVLDLSSLSMTVYAGPESLGSVEVGDSVEVELANGPRRGDRVPAIVTFVDPFIDPASSTLRIRVRIDPAPGITAGLSARLHLKSRIPVKG